MELLVVLEDDGVRGKMREVVNECLNCMNRDMSQSITYIKNEEQKE